MSKEDRPVLRLAAVLQDLKMVRKATLETAIGLNNYFVDQLRKILDLVSITPTIIAKAVIAVEPAICFCLEGMHRRGMTTMQNEPFASFVCQTAENCYKSYCFSFLL